MSKNYEKYMDAVRLLRKTTKIETTLENAGGSGGGIWEKACSISDIFPQDFMTKIINIAKIRNDTVHGDLQVKDIDIAINKCNEILEILEVNKKFRDLNIIITNKMAILDSSQIYEFSEELDRWIADINRFNMNENHKFNILLENESRMLKELNGFVIKKILKKVVILFGIGLIVAFVYIVFRMNK